MEKLSPSNIQRNKVIQRCNSNLTFFNFNWKNAEENITKNIKKQFEENHFG